MKKGRQGAAWRVIEIMKECDVDIVLTLPCEKMKTLFHLVASSQDFCHVPLTREENGVGIAAGVFLGGGRPVMLIQSTGLGNSINAIMSLSVTYGMALPVLASWRGVHHEKIPAQIPLGRALPQVLEALGLPYTVINDHTEVKLVRDAILHAFENEAPHVVLISPRTWEDDPNVGAGVKFPARRRLSALEYSMEIREPEMTRFDAIKVISEHLSDEVVVSNIGVPSKELFAVKDRPLNFYMLGSLGQASSIGLGLALKTKREVFVLDGDGALLMSGVLPTVADKSEAARNLTIFCLDNGTWGSTGDQPTHAYHRIDMELLAKASGIKNTMKAQTEEELREVLRSLHEVEGPRFVHVLVRPGNASVGNIPLTPTEIKDRFRKALLG